MILAVNIGNSVVSAGLVESGQVSTTAAVPRSEGPNGLHRVWAQLVLEQQRGVEGCCVCSVVPDLTSGLVEACGRVGSDVMVVDHRTDTGLRLTYANPTELGPDRLVNAYAAWKLYGPTAIVVDLGTATTFDLVGAGGVHHGGAIAAGMGSTAHALHRTTALLPLVEPAEPVRVVGASTVDALLTGLFWGTVEMVDGLVARLSREVELTGTVVATGGWCELVGPRCRTVDVVDRWLTLKGLGLLWNRVRGERSETTNHK